MSEFSKCRIFNNATWLHVLEYIQAQGFSYFQLAGVWALEEVLAATVNSITSLGLIVPAFNFTVSEYLGFLVARCVVIFDCKCNELQCKFLSV